MRLTSSTVDIPEWVMVPSSVLGEAFQIGRVISSWRNTVQVLFAQPDGSTLLGQYTIIKHQFSEPSLSDWLAFAQLNGDFT